MEDEKENLENFSKKFVHSHNENLISCVKGQENEEKAKEKKQEQGNIPMKNLHSKQNKRGETKRKYEKWKKIPQIPFVCLINVAMI